MSGVGGIGGGSETYYYNLEQNQAYIMNQNQLVPVQNEAVEEILRQNDIAIKNGKAYSISDGFEIKAGDALIITGNGGVPALPPTIGASNVHNDNKPDVGKAINRLADSSGSCASLLFMQLMTLMKTAREDKESNSELVQILQKGKVGQMREELSSLEAQHKAENAADQTEFILNTVSQGLSAVISLVGMIPGVSGTNSFYATQMAGHLLETSPKIFKKASYENGDLAQKGKEISRQGEFQKEAEIIQQTVDMVKAGSDNAKKSFQNALKLLEGVAQRQNDNIKAMNV